MLPIENGMQATLVAFYGPKPAEFLKLIRSAHARIAATLGDAFIPYAPEQVHATIVGLEGRRFADRIINQNYLDHRGEIRLVNPQTVLMWAQGLELTAIVVRIGGYAAARDYGFTSRGQHPYERSFAIRGGIAVAMGWPATPLRLDEIRREFGGIGALHKEHRAEQDVDDDFYFVLGRVDESAGSDLIERTQRDMREWLASTNIALIIDPAALSIVGYTDPCLPPETSCAFRVADTALSGDVLLCLYPPV
ncbi:MAG TPA: hypothetical protein VF092_09660 [Longimicrobium sp.]